MANGEHPELPALEPVLGRQRHAAAGDGRSVRRAGHRLRGRRVQGRADAEVQLRLRGVPRRRPRQLPEGGLQQGGAAGRPGDGAAEERLAVRRADPAHGRARPRATCCRAARSTTSPRVKAQVDYIKAARAGRRDPRASASRRSRRDRRRARDAARRQAPRPLDVHRPRCRDRPRVHVARTTRRTRCHFCPNNCARTFIDARTPDGGTSRYISGFSCEKGTVESVEALKALTARRKDLRLRFPEPRRLREQACCSAASTRRDPLPAAGTLVDDVRGEADAARRRQAGRRCGGRSSDRRRRRRERRDELRIGIPRVLNIYSTAPIWRTYFEALGIRSEHVVFSDYTSEEMWTEGGKYGSIDPCYPVEGGQAHIHNLLFHKHARHAVRLHLLPVHHARADLRRQHDGQRVVPDRRRRAEGDARRVHEGGRLLRRARDRVRRRRRDARRAELLREADVRDVGRAARHHRGRERLRLPRRASRRSRALDDDLQRRGPRDPASSSRRRTASACCCSGGRITSIPASITASSTSSRRSAIRCCRSARFRRTAQWLARFFKDDLERGFVESPLDISDVWPENYSANSVQKVWARQVRGAPSERRRARSLELQVRPRRADLRADRQHHLVEPDAVLGAARHRREQAGRLDQDPRARPTRTRCRCTRSGSQDLRGEAIGAAAARRREAARAAARAAQTALAERRRAGAPGDAHRARRRDGRRVPRRIWPRTRCSPAASEQQPTPTPTSRTMTIPMTPDTLPDCRTTTTIEAELKAFEDGGAAAAAAWTTSRSRTGSTPTRRRSRAPSAATRRSCSAG